MRNLSKLMLGAGLVVASLASVMGTEAKAQVNFVAPQQSSVSASSTLTTTTRIGQIRSATSSAAIEIQLPAHNYYYSGEHTLNTVTSGGAGVADYISNINLQSDAPTVFAARPAITAAAAIDPSSFEAGAVAAFGTATDADKVALIESWRRGDAENAPFYAVPQESSGSGVATQTTVARQGDVRTRSVSAAIEVQLPSNSAYFDTDGNGAGIPANLDVDVSGAGTLGVTIDQLAFDPGLATEYTAFAPVATPIAANSFEGVVSNYVGTTTSSNASAAIEAWQTGGLD
ncbi:MAG: hypothetical protein WA902_11200 [Thermosynechococcaceae cyanobacterium]